MTNEPDDNQEIASKTVLIIAVLVTLAIDGFVVGFSYKVWNERQMTHEYHEQAVQLARIANVLEGGR